MPILVSGSGIRPDLTEVLSFKSGFPLCIYFLSVLLFPLHKEKTTTNIFLILKEL